LNASGEQELSASISDLLVEFYPGKRKRNGQTIKTGHIYWTFTRYQAGQRQRISPKRYAPDAFGYAGATSIENCPYTGRVEQYRRKSRRPAGDTGKSGGFWYWRMVSRIWTAYQYRQYWKRTRKFRNDIEVYHGIGTGVTGVRDASPGANACYCHTDARKCPCYRHAYPTDV
jgi:hypothetical protein